MNPFQTSPQIIIQKFHQRHLEQASLLISKNYFQPQLRWTKGNQNYEQINKIVRKQIMKGLYSGMSFILKYKRKIIGVSITIDMVDYFNNPTFNYQYQNFEFLAKYIRIFDQIILQKKIKRGQIVYGMYGVIDPQYKNNGFYLKFWWFQFSIGRYVGFKFFYTLLFTRISKNMLSKIGFKIIKTLKITDQDEFQISLVEFSIQQIKVYSQMIKDILPKSSL